MTNEKGLMTMMTFDRGSAMGEIGGVHRIIGELDCVVGFEPLFDVGKPVLVILGSDVQGSAEGVLADLTVLDDHLARLDDEPQHPSGASPCDDGDFIKGVLPIQVLQYGALQHTRMDALKNLLTIIAIHQ